MQFFMLKVTLSCRNQNKIISWIFMFQTVGNISNFNILTIFNVDCSSFIKKNILLHIYCKSLDVRVNRVTNF